MPTRELATQVRDELAPIGAVRDINVAAIYGGADMEKQIKKLKAEMYFSLMIHYTKHLPEINLKSK